MTNDELCRVMDIVLREIECNVSFSIDEMRKMDLNGHCAEFWLARWNEMGLARFWCVLDDVNRNKFVYYLMQKKKFHELQ